MSRRGWSRSALLIAAWYAGSQIAGPRMLPRPAGGRLLAMWTEARSGALAFNLGVTLARVAVSFAIAMALGTVLGVLMGRSSPRRPARRSLAGGAAQPAGAGHHRARLCVGGPDRNRRDRGRRPQQAAQSRPLRCARARARSTASSTRWRRCSAWARGCGCGTCCCPSLRPISPRRRARGCRWCGRSS